MMRLDAFFFISSSRREKRPKAGAAWLLIASFLIIVPAGTGRSDKCQIKYKNQKGIKKKNRKENKSV